MIAKAKLCLVAFLLMALTPIIAYAAEAFSINNFDSTITIKPDGKVAVVETLDVNFTAERHGIFRDLPLTYSRNDGTTFYTNIEVLGVTDGKSAVPYTITRNRVNLRIVIGDKNRLVFGSQKYVITYDATGVLTALEQYDELYWNVTGNNWEAPIEKSSATVILPSDRIQQSACYVGQSGATQTCTIASQSARKITFQSPDALATGEGLTVAVGYTKGMVPILSVNPPKTLAAVVTGKETTWAFLVTVFLGIAGAFWLWLKRGRDQFYRRKNLHDLNQTVSDLPIGTHETIVPEYDPPQGLRPAEIGVLVDERADTLDVSATIVDLAVRGYLTITEEQKKWLFGKTDYSLKRTNKTANQLLGYEQELLNKLFDLGNPVKLSELKNSFYTSLSAVKKLLYDDIADKKLFDGNPQRIRTKYYIFAVLISVVGTLLLWPGFAGLLGIYIGSGAGLVITGSIFFVVAMFIPRRTAIGRETYRQSLGYKMFVSGTEKYRQPFFERENIFMQVLPYAMVFGVTKKLANAMKEMGISQSAPGWYVGSTAFSVDSFNSQIESFSQSLSTAMASAPGGSGSGGGGSSGGGFGGGGGGSW